MRRTARSIILTNADGAADFKIVTAPVDSPGRENWADLLPHEPGRLILAHAVHARHLIRLERVESLGAHCGAASR